MFRFPGGRNFILSYPLRPYPLPRSTSRSTSHSNYSNQRTNATIATFATDPRRSPSHETDHASSTRSSSSPSSSSSSNAEKTYYTPVSTGQGDERMSKMEQLEAVMKDPKKRDEFFKKNPHLEHLRH